MKPLLKVGAITLSTNLPLLSAVEAEFDHSVFDDLLQTHVDKGLVDYQSLRSDSRLPTYLEQLENADLGALESREEQMALWINAYNAYTLQLIVDHYPVGSIMDIYEDWNWTLNTKK